MSTEEANECKNRADASTQALNAYYQQPGAAQYKTVHSEQQRIF